ncbi:MAG: hypothetical protein RMA76_10580 [Deltaproteobacteria bacterium]|jgi:hypothetical protein
MDPSELDELYAGPLAEFVSRRNDLAKALKRAGRKDDAATVKALRKPSLGAWAINQIVRREPDVLRAVFDALDRVKAAQLGGAPESERPALADAMAEERAALAAVESTAESILTQAEQTATKATLDRVVRSVRASAVEPTRREQLMLGQVTEDVADAGFSDLAAQLMGGLVPAAPKAAPSPKPLPTPAAPRAPRPAPGKAPPDTIDLAAERERREKIEAEARAKARRERIDNYRRELKALRLSEEKLDKDLAQAALEVQRAEERLDRARNHHTRAKERVTSARAQRQELEEALAALERAD